jgi:tetratricopeptide (TPR) repeat protein
LSPIAHRDLRRTVWALSGYPEDDESADIYDDTDPNGTQDHGLRGRMLRAAYGIVRSIYSVSCLARFNVEHEETDANGSATLFSGSPGIFEEHRRQIRWMLKEAIELTRNNKNAYVPYYAEEIVWLYNESAILSLIQGCVPDAIALFYLADRAAARIEPSPTGPLRALILLNRAVAEIERGRLGWARDALDRIVAAVRYDKDPDAHIIAKGYLALVYHLKGNTDQALSLYEEVTKDLVRRGRSRAAAIFTRHYGDLIRSSGSDREVAARHKLESAVRFSAEGRHEDIRQLAMLSRARLLLGSADASKSADIHAILSSVERYACVMGMPRLLSEIEEIRARLYRRNGDLRSAGSAASNSLEIASLNELRLRKASCLGLLAGIDLDRGFASECEILRQDALALAEEIGYEAVLVAAHALGHRLQGGAPSRPSGN